MALKERLPVEPIDSRTEAVRGNLVQILAEVEAGRISPEEARRLIEETKTRSHTAFYEVVRALLGP